MLLTIILNLRLSYLYISPLWSSLNSHSWSQYCSWQGDLLGGGLLLLVQDSFLGLRNSCSCSQ